MKKICVYLRYIWSDLFYDKVASYTLVGIIAIINIFNLISGLCIKESGECIENVTGKLGADIAIVSKEYDESMQEALFMGYPSTIIFDASFMDSIKELEGVDVITKQTFLSSLDSSCCMEQLQFIVFDENDFIVESMIDEFESQNEKRDIIIGSDIQYNIGDKVKFFDCVFCVAGKLKPTGMGYDSCIFVNDKVSKSITNFLRIDEVGNQASIILIKVNEGIDFEALIESINSQINDKNVIAYGTKDLYRDMEKDIKSFSKTIGISFDMIFILSSLSIFGIITLSTDIKKKSYATLDLLGVSRMGKSCIVIAEGILVSIFGAAIGNILGILFFLCFKNPIENAFCIPIDITMNGISIIAKGVFVSVIAIVLASIYAAYSVFGMKCTSRRV